MNLSVKVLIGLGLGMAVGLLMNVLALNAEGTWTETYVISGVFHTVGALFINALKMLVVPLVLFSLIPGVVGIGDIRLLGRVGGKSFVLYLATTAVAITTALFLANTFNIGKGLEMDLDQATFVGEEAPSLSQVLIDIVPSNPVAALANGDMLPIIFYAVLFGVCLLAVRKDCDQLVAVIDQINLVIMKMVSLVMLAAPYAVFCLVAKSVAQLGLDLLVSLGAYASVLIAVLLFHGGVTLMLVCRFLAGLSPVMFLKKIYPAQLFAFSTASSSATIPVTLRAVQQRMGVDRSVASFTVPLGATVNMDGTAMMQGVAAVFIANIYGMDLTLVDYMIVVLMAVLASIGTAGVPGVGLVMLAMVFDQVGIPVEGVGLILGVDRLLDMLRTVVNITGDSVVTCVVAKSEGRLDQQVFDDQDAGVIRE